MDGCEPPQLTASATADVELGYRYTLGCRRARTGVRLEVGSLGAVVAGGALLHLGDTTDAAWLRAPAIPLVVSGVAGLAVAPFVVASGAWAETRALHGFGITVVPPLFRWEYAAVSAAAITWMTVDAVGDVPASELVAGDIGMAGGFALGYLWIAHVDARHAAHPERHGRLFVVGPMAVGTF